MSKEALVNLKPAHERRFKTLIIDALGNINTEEGYDRAVEPIPKMLEHLADTLDQLPDPDPVAKLDVEVKFPLTLSCQWVICQFHEQYPNVTLLIKDQNGKVTYFQGNKLPPETVEKE